jgi:hypothetical protein
MFEAVVKQPPSEIDAKPIAASAALRIIVLPLRPRATTAHAICAEMVVRYSPLHHRSSLGLGRDGGLWPDSESPILVR